MESSNVHTPSDSTLSKPRLTARFALTELTRELDVKDLFRKQPPHDILVPKSLSGVGKLSAYE